MNGFCRLQAQGSTSMTSDRSFEKQTSAVLSLSDLNQIKKAVNELRASNPRSILADLVDEKLRALDRDDAMTRHAFSASDARWIIA
jgi:DNA-binding HxlR family transcriptional regulator